MDPNLQEESKGPPEAQPNPPFADGMAVDSASLTPLQTGSDANPLSQFRDVTDKIRMPQRNRTKAKHE